MGTIVLKKDNDEWKRYERFGITEMRPYIPGELMAGISVSSVDNPKKGGMIARNPKNHSDMWYVAEKYFRDNYKQINREKNL